MLAIAQNTLFQENLATTQVSRILVPVDFSRRCTSVATFAVDLARRFYAKVTLLHVEQPSEGDPYGMVGDVRWVEGRMARFLPESTKDQNVRRIIHISPDIAHEILITARGIKADLIVMPTHGYGGFRRVLLGSVAATVLRDAPCPVWTTAHAAPVEHSEWLNPGRVLCAVNSLPEDASALSWASRLASELNAKLCIAWSQKVLTEMRGDIKRASREYEIEVETMIEAENAPESLRRAAKTMKAGLMVVDGHAWKTSVESTLDMYQIVREVPCPIVSI